MGETAARSVRYHFDVVMLAPRVVEKRDAWLLDGDIVRRACCLQNLLIVQAMVEKKGKCSASCSQRPRQHSCWFLDLDMGQNETE